MPPTEEVSHDHITAELVNGRCFPIPIGLQLPMIVGDGLFFDGTAVTDSVIREDTTSAAYMLHLFPFANVYMTHSHIIYTVVTCSGTHNYVEKLYTY